MPNEDEQEPQGVDAAVHTGAADAEPDAATQGPSKSQRAREADAPAADAAAPPPPDATADLPPPAPEPEITVYHKTVWNGYVAFVCNFCGHGVLDYAGNDGEQEMQVHIWNDHQKPAAPRPPQFSGLLVDRQGRPITG